MQTSCSPPTQLLQHIYLPQKGAVPANEESDEEDDEDIDFDDDDFEGNFLAQERENKLSIFVCNIVFGC